MIYELDYDHRYWNALSPIIGNDIGVAALMGNWEAESNLIPYRLQGDFPNESGQYAGSIAYTEGLNNGTITRATFIGDSKGYSVAQWTYNTRKERYYDLHTSTGLECGSFELSIRMFEEEMNNGYTNTFDALKNATNIRTASDYVLHNYEQPADQGVEQEVLRATYAQEFYEKYHGTGPVPTRGKMPLYLYIGRRQRG